MRRLWPWLRLLIAVGMLAVLAWRLGTGAFLDGLRMINGWSLVAALGIGLLTTVCSAWRWCLVARGLGLPLTLRTALADYYQALLLNAVLPAGVLGDVHRAVSHGRQSGDVGRGVRAVVLERFAGQVALAVVAVAVLLADPALISTVAGDLVPSREVVLAVVAVLVVVVALVAWARRGTSGWRKGVATALTDARLGLLARDTGPGVALLSIVTVLGHVALFLVAARVAGASAPVTQLVPLLVLALVVMGLPINVGGWGPREAFLAVAFGATGLGAAQGLAAGVVYGVLTLVASLPGAAVLFLRRAPKAAPRTPRPALPADPFPWAPMPATGGRPHPIRYREPARS
jgi:uncharacterized membrane protein YbhN (UPF0104 family)